MAKRSTGVGAKRAKLKSPHKTAKRIAAKHERLSALKEKRGN
jgi:hypothetical protein